ncbi:MAG: hypothetical protein ACW981_15335 [Candidatus Hodarchaeales archaeon]|jgi:hypothetical protein
MNSFLGNGTYILVANQRETSFWGYIIILLATAPFLLVGLGVLLLYQKKQKK